MGEMHPPHPLPISLYEHHQQQKHLEQLARRYNLDICNRDIKGDCRPSLLLPRDLLCRALSCSALRISCNANALSIYNKALVLESSRSI